MSRRACRLRDAKRATPIHPQTRIACARAIGQPRGHELKIIQQPRKKSQQGYEETAPPSPFQGKAGITKLCLYARNDHTKHSPNVHTLQAEKEGIRYKLPSCVICLASGARKERNTIPYEHLVGNKESKGNNPHQRKWSLPPNLS